MVLVLSMILREPQGVHSPMSPVWSQPSVSTLAIVLTSSLKYPWNTLTPLMQTSPWPAAVKYSMLATSSSLIMLQGRGGPTWPGWMSPGSVRVQGAEHSERP